MNCIRPTKAADDNGDGGGKPIASHRVENGSRVMTSLNNVQKRVTEIELLAAGYDDIFDDLWEYVVVLVKHAASFNASCNRIKDAVSAINARLDEYDTTMQSLQNTYALIEARLGELEHRLGTLESTQSTMMKGASALKRALVAAQASLSTDGMLSQ